MWAIRSHLSRMIIGKDNEMATLGFLQALRFNKTLPRDGQRTEINHTVSNKTDGRKTFKITVTLVRIDP